MLFSRLTIGVTIDHSSVKVVGISHGKKPHLVGCAEVALDSQSSQREGFAEPAVIGAAIRKAMGKAAPKAVSGSTVYTAVPESLVFRKVLEFPIINDVQELEQSVSLEVAQYLPAPIEEMEVDYQLLGINKDKTKQQVMVVAVERKIVEDYLKVFEAAKLDVKAIDARPAAVGRAIVAEDEKEALILVDVSSETTTISVYDRRLVQVTASVNLGGMSIQESGKSEVEQTQSLKRLAADISDELRSVLKFYAGQAAELSEPKKITQLRLSGSGSMIPGFSDLLAAAVDLKVQPAKAVISLPPFCDRRYIAALGCALYPLYEKLEDK